MAAAGEINPTLRVILKLCKGLQMWPSELAELTELRWEELRGGGDARSSVEPRTIARSQTQMSWHGSASSHEANVLPFARPTRPRSAELPEHLVTASEASLRATEVYARLLHDRLEHTRRARIGRSLGRLDAGALERVIAASDALHHASEDALTQIDRQIATRARLVAQAAAERVPGGRGEAGIRGGCSCTLSEPPRRRLLS